MSKREDLELVSDIKEATKRIENYIGNLTRQKFVKDLKTQDAIVRNLEIIGEATKNISADFKKKHKNVDWKKIAGMRDKLIHHYFGVNLDIVWDVVKKKLPELITNLKDIQLHNKIKNERA